MTGPEVGYARTRRGRISAGVQVRVPGCRYDGVTGSRYLLGVLRAQATHWEHMQIKATFTPECSIEFTATWWGGAHVSGDLKYSTENIAGSDPDELEPTEAATA